MDTTTTSTTEAEPEIVVTATTSPAPEPLVSGYTNTQLMAIAACEQPGSGEGGVYWEHRGPTYEGGPGFWYGTWDTFKPAGAPDNAGDATVEQQLQGMRNIFAAHPDAWATCRAKVGL